MRTKANQVTQGIINNIRCQICGVLSDRVCNECLALGMLACFCDNHENTHRTERMHIAYWGALAK